MKVKVNRQLTAGKYHVNFEVAGFTPEELGKMSSFGVPTILLKFMSSNGIANIKVQLNKIQKGYNAAFDTEELANEYETSVIDQIKKEMTRLRQLEDDFTSNIEVNL